jgi:exopolysaccharide biosynthesis polyprenyl glycosylphosphotransferase
MLKSKRTAYFIETLILDAIALFFAFVAAWALRDSFVVSLMRLGNLFNYPIEGMIRRAQDLPKDSLYRTLLSTNPLIGFKSHLWIFLLAAPPWLFFLNAQRGYDPQVQRSARQQFAICAYAGMMGMAALLVLLYLLRFQISRLLLLNWMAFGIALLWTTRTVLIPALRRNSHSVERHLLVIGSRASAVQFTTLLKTPAYRGAHLVGYISDEPTVVAPDNPTNSVTQLGHLNDLASVLDRQVVDEVILVRSQTDASGTAESWGDILELCLQRGRTVSLVDDIVPPVGAKMEATMTGTMPTLVMHNTPQNTLGLAGKSVMDRVLAFSMLFLLTFIIPVFPVVALLIKLHDRGPVFFAQDRVGLNGRLFKFYKFRSMAVNAQELLETMKRDDPERYRAINIMEEPFFKAKDGDDPRITPIGRIIRKYSIDELPQFWNVLIGDMSLVGPRPPLPKEVAELEPWQRRKLSVKGGLTCIWQATGRNDITEVDEWMRLDLEYIDNWSLWLDVKLLFKTVQVLIKPKGAS